MTDLQIKLKLIYLRFLLIALGFIAVYTFFNRYLVLQTSWLPISEMIANLLLPFSLPIIPVLVWLLPRIKLLQFKTKAGKDPAGLYVMVAAFGIAVPAIFAQTYMTTATGKLTSLYNISSINQHPLTKYYKLQRYHIDKRHSQPYFTKETTGKNNANLVFGVYIVCPIMDAATAPAPNPPPAIVSEMHTNKGVNWLKDKHSPLVVINGVIADTNTLNNLDPRRVASVTVLKGKSATVLYGDRAANGALLMILKLLSPPKAWLGIYYTKTISNSLSKPEKDTLYNSFTLNVYNDFRLKDINRFIYLDRIGRNQRHNNYNNAVKETAAYNKSGPIIFEAINQPFEARNGNQPFWMLITFAIGACIFFLMLLVPQLNVAKAKLLLPDDPHDWRPPVITRETKF